MLCSLAHGSVRGREIVWRVVKREIAFLKEKLGGQFLLSGMLKSVTSGFFTEDKMTEVRQFFDENPVNNAKMAISQGITHILQIL